MLRTTVVAVLMAIAGLCEAVLPDNGWYWNPAESGRGFNIEIQDNILFVAAFVYDAQGKPIWLVSGGPMTGDHTYSGTLYQTPSGGQCVGCPYSGAPAEIPWGTIAIVFNGTNATITINGTVINARHMELGLDFTSIAQPLLGEWAIVSGETSFPIYFAERIRFTQTQVLQNELTATGSRAGSVTSIAVGGYEPGLGKWTVLMDSSTSYYKYYVFSFAGFERIEGDEYLFKKTELPTFSDPFLGQRIKSATAARGLVGPGTGKVDRASEIDLLDDNRAANQLSGVRSTSNKAVIEAAQRLITRMKEAGVQD